MKSLYPIAWAIGLGVVSVIADYFLKRASESPNAFQTPYFITGAAIFALSSFGWVYVLRHVKLAAIGAIYSVVTVVGLAAVELVILNEPFTKTEWLGLSLAISSLVLLSRFTMT
jgi:multidrug transporter EmrE-like cation transporter